MPIQAPLVLTWTKSSAWLRVRGNQDTSRGEVSTLSFLTVLGGSPWMVRRLASPMGQCFGVAKASEAKAGLRPPRVQGRPKRFAPSCGP